MKPRLGAYTLTTNKAKLDVDAIHRFLCESYWARGIARETVARSIEHSRVYAVLHGKALAGFARVVTDQATFAYLADVFVLEEHRGRGLARWLVQSIIEDPELAGIRRWLLVTRDAHRLYARFGFRLVEDPGRFMEIVRPHVAEA